MSDLPFVKRQVLNDLELEIEQMRRGGSRDNPKPHKLIMLLTVLVLFDRGVLTENKIELSQHLLTTFREYFNKYASPSDWCQPGPPFFHLRSTTFWKHKIIPGRETAYDQLLTTGGGLKWIKENVQYAYFDQTVYSSVILDDQCRQYLICRLEEMLLENNRSLPQPRLPTVFHESFSLSRPSLSQILKSVSTVDSNIDFRQTKSRFDFFRVNTTLGMNYVKSMPEYAKGAGLIDADYRLTKLGEYIIEYDASLDLISTQWLVHYYLSRSLGPGPIFWHDLVTTRFRSGDTFLHEDIVCQIANIFKQFEGKPLSNRSASTTTTIFLGSYIKNDGLGKLGILEEMGNKTYRVLDPELPPNWVVAIAILDYWKAHFPNQITINLNDLLAEKGLTSQFMISRSRLTLILGEMQEAGIVELFRIAPPYQVALLQSDPEPLYRRLYASNECD